MLQVLRKVVIVLLLLQAVLFVSILYIGMVADGLEGLAVIYPVLGIFAIVPLVSLGGIVLAVKKQSVPLLVLIGVALNILILIVFFIRFVVIDTLLSRA